MKYPVIKVNKLPYSFKNSSIAVAACIMFENDEAYLQGEDLDKKRAYLEFIKKEIFILTDSMMTLYRPEILKYQDTYVVVLKDNVNIYQLKEAIEKMMIEITKYTNNTLKVSASIVERVLLLEDGKEPSMFKANKVGLPIFESEEYKQGIFVPEKTFDSKELSYITPYAEYLLTKYKK